MLIFIGFACMGAGFVLGVAMSEMFHAAPLREDIPPYWDSRNESPDDLYKKKETMI